MAKPSYSDQEFERASRHIDFIKRYIFPGSCIPSVTAMCQAMTSASDLKMVHLEDFTPHYATTLRMWRENFFDRIVDVSAQGYPDAFIRMWDFYLCYCEGAFLERAIGDVQVLLTKPGYRGAPLTPPL